MKKLLPALSESIFEPTYDVAFDTAEIAIDAIFENEVIQNIPIVKTLAALCEVGYNVRERNLLKLTLTFIQELNNGTISSNKLNKYRESIKNDPKKAEKELGRVLIILGNHIDDIKSQILGSFFKSYINDAISWDKFCELSEANRRMFVGDYKVLIKANKEKGLNIDKQELYEVDRLISLGLLQNENRLGGVVSILLGEESNNGKDVIVTSFGRSFCQHMPYSMK